MKLGPWHMYGQFGDRYRLEGRGTGNFGYGFGSQNFYFWLRETNEWFYFFVPDSLPNNYRRVICDLIGLKLGYKLSNETI